MKIGSKKTHTDEYTRSMIWCGVPGPFSSAKHGRHLRIPAASYCSGSLTHVSDIKLIRTDTTLDVSQKAEKGMICLDLDESGSSRVLVKLYTVELYLSHIF